MMPLGVVAGLGALLVAKLDKLAEHEPTPARWAPKDGLDVPRILQAAELGQLGATLAGFERHDVAGPITREARRLLGSLFGTQAAPGTAMAIHASYEVEHAATIALVCETLASRLLAAWERALGTP